MTKTEVLFLHALEQEFNTSELIPPFSDSLNDLSYVRFLLKNSAARSEFYESKMESRFKSFSFGEDLLPLIGRDFEVKLIENNFSNGMQVVNLSGRGGMGKSRLAREIGRRFGASVWVVPCRGVESSEELRMRIHAQIGLDQTESLETELHDQRGLIILDNLEHSVHLEGLMESIATAQRVKVLVLSRKRIVARGEGHIDLQCLSIHHAREFIKSLLGSAVTDGLTSALPRLTRAPLGLIVAASLLVAEPSMAIRLPQVTRSASSDNHIIHESMNRLTSKQIALLHALAVFESPLRESSAKRVIELSGCLNKDLQRLQSAGFIETIPGKFSALSVHDVFREQVQFAARSRDLVDQAAVSAEIHSTVICELAISVGQHMKEDRWSQGIELLHSIRADCQKAAKNSEKFGDSKSAIGIAIGVSRTLFELGFIKDFKQVSDTAVRAAQREGNQDALLELLGLTGAMAGREQNEQKCREIWLQRLEIARELNARAVEADALSDLAWQSFELQDFSLATAYLDSSIQIATEDNEIELLATGLAMRARILMKMGRPDEADSALANVETLLPLCKDRGMTSFVYYSLAGASLQREDLESAERWLKTLLRQAADGQLAIMMGYSLRNLAPIFESRLDSTKAVACLVAAVRVHQEYSTRHHRMAVKALNEFEDRSGLESSTKIALALDKPWLELVELALSEVSA